MLPTQNKSQMNSSSKPTNTKKRKQRPSEILHVFCAACWDMQKKSIKLQKCNIAKHYQNKDNKESHAQYSKDNPNTKYYEISHTGQPKKKNKKQ